MQTPSHQDVLRRNTETTSPDSVYTMRVPPIAASLIRKKTRIIFPFPWWSVNEFVSFYQEANMDAGKISQ